MTRRCVAALTIGLMAVSGHPLRAEVKTEEKTLVRFEGMLGRVAGMFGGRAAREGVTTTVAVKGDRKVSLTDQNQTGQIIDLAEEKIYDLDLRRKTYKVTTFAELRRQMEEARRKAAEDMKKAQAEAKTQTPAEPAARDGKEMEIDFDLKETGQKRTINGFDARQIVMTITLREKGRTIEQSGGLVLTSDIWMTPAIRAMREVTDFDIRYAKAIAGPMLTGASAQDMAAAMAMYPGMQEAIARMRAENVKLDGTAVQTTTTIDAVQSAEQMAAAAKEQQGAQSDSSQPSGVGGLLGGLGRRMANRGNANSGAASQRPGRATFMTMTNEVLKVTTTVSEADVAVPAGFKESR